MFAGACILLVVCVVTLRATKENKRTSHIDAEGKNKHAESMNVLVTLHMLQGSVAQLQTTMANIDVNVRLIKERNEDYMDEIRDLTEKAK